MKTGLEAVLQAMVTGAWANASDGDVDSPVGAFARVTNEPVDMHEIANAFNDVMSAYECEVDSLIGYWLVCEDSAGFIKVTAFDNEPALTMAYQELEDAYAEWLNE